MEKFAPLNMSPEELIEYTPEWEGERFADGRPKVPDDILERMRNVSITQAWGVIRGPGYNWQYEDGWICTHPGQVLVGRALTAMYMPRRPVMRQVMEEKGERAGCIGDQISWPIDMLVPGDVYVADVFGKIDQGAVIGDNLATAIYANSGNGVVHDAAVRDIDGIQELPNFTSFVRGFHPTFASPTIMLTGVNCPVRIGGATVMPGDVVLGRDDGVVFIPPHLAEQVVKTSELISLRDRFGKQRLAEGKYTPGQIDTRWSDPIEEDFSRWLESHIDELPVPRAAIQELLKERTW
ncbi:MAG: RraA family protein [Gemmatimonadetes bacterium]|nr:RraA family protein [Gemmatimonadota bacterium]MXW80265.1 RraA family protein [Gemmatimonadota bacterium]MYC73579.1 RraA family protein [Gemmatimonadota bacterium]MYI64081.1 RraA family protein [Gemmatimonadota bacterium]